MSHFVLLKTLVEQQFADQVCQALEDNEISVMLEHVTLPFEGKPISGYRVYVPAESTQSALRLLSVCEDMNRASNPTSASSLNSLVRKQAA